MIAEQIPRATILAAEDPGDTNADGISGRAHVLGDGRVGRLGWKASVPNLAEFARDGMSNELGMTLADQTGLTFGAGSDNDAAPDPEVSAAELADLVFYMANLAPPPRNRVNEALKTLANKCLQHWLRRLPHAKYEHRSGCAGELV
ncbi:MAG: di-heme oxidoredictase family protein [Myxococcota bacterium]